MTKTMFIALVATSTLVFAAGCAEDAPSPEKTADAGPTHVEGLPPGATGCSVVYQEVTVPFNAGARGTPMTSCPLVEQVRREYARRAAPLSGPQQMRVPSPKTAKWYDLECTPTGDFVTCMAGVAVIIYLYNAPD